MLYIMYIIYYIIWGRQERLIGSLYIEILYIVLPSFFLLLSCWFFLLSSCIFCVASSFSLLASFVLLLPSLFLLLLCCFFFHHGPSWSILAACWTILAPSWLPRGPQSHLRISISSRISLFSSLGIEILEEIQILGSPEAPRAILELVFLRGFHFLVHLESKSSKRSQFLAPRAK